MARQFWRSAFEVALAAALATSLAVCASRCCSNAARDSARKLSGAWVKFDKYGAPRADLTDEEKAAYERARKKTGDAIAAIAKRTGAEEDAK